MIDLTEKERQYLESLCVEVIYGVERSPDMVSRLVTVDGRNTKIRCYDTPKKLSIAYTEQLHYKHDNEAHL